MITCTAPDGAGLCGGDIDALSYCIRCGVLAVPPPQPPPA